MMLPPPDLEVDYRDNALQEIFWIRDFQLLHSDLFGVPPSDLVQAQATLN